MNLKDQVNMSIDLYKTETENTEKMQKLKVAATESNKSKLGHTLSTPASG